MPSGIAVLTLLTYFVLLVVFYLHTSTLTTVQPQHSRRRQEPFWFSDQEVVSFRTQYIARIKNLPPSSVTASFACGVAGLGSVLNNEVFFGFMLAVKYNMSFHVYTEKYCTSFKDIFDDWTAPHVTTPMFLDGLPLTNITDMLKAQRLFHCVDRLDARLYKDPKHIILKRRRPNFNKVRSCASSNRDYSAKALVAKAFWEPLPRLRRIARLLHEKITALCGYFLAVHIRRTDHITEAPYTEQVVLLRKIYELLSNATANRTNLCVFGFSDDPPFLLQLLNSTRNLVIPSNTTTITTPAHVFSLSDLLSEAGIRGMNVSETAEVLYNKPLTTDFIVSVTLASRADDVLCSMSSNVCRLLGLLVPSLEVMHDADSDEEQPLRGWHIH